MEKIILALGNGREETGPFAANRQLFVGRRADVTERVPCRSPGGQRLQRLLVFGGRRECHFREVEMHSVARADEEETLAKLGDTKRRCIEHGRRWTIARA